MINSSSTGIISLSSIKQEIWSSITSLVFEIVSSTVSPYEKHPERAGTSDQNPPSSALWIIIVYSMIFPLIVIFQMPVLSIPLFVSVCRRY